MRHTFSRPLWGLPIIASVIAGAAPVAALVAGEISAAHERLRQDRDYQFDFGDQPPRPPAPGWLRAVAEFIASIVELLAPLIKIVFWLGVIAIVLGAIFFIGREILRRIERRNDSEETAPEEPLYRPKPALAQALLEEADRLAAEGRYGDAVHVLLFRSIEDIQKQRPNRVRKAMTSREIAHLPILPTPARRAFAQIADAVEKSHFAGRSIGADIFTECRAAYGVFAAPEGWTA